jgi:hypothetical protein
MVMTHEGMCFCFGIFVCRFPFDDSSHTIGLFVASSHKPNITMSIPLPYFAKGLFEYKAVEDTELSIGKGRLLLHLSTYPTIQPTIQLHHYHVGVVIY